MTNYHPKDNHFQSRLAAIEGRPEREPSRPYRIRRKRCEECGINWADPPSRICPGCEAYREHQA